MEKKNIVWWIIFVLLCIWQLPQLLVGLVMLPFLRKKKLVADRHFNFCWRAENMYGGISLGPISFVSKNSGAASIAHEVDGHTKDSKIFSWFYLFVIGLPSILNATFNFTKCYYDFYPEKRANRFAKLDVSNKCSLRTTPETIIQEELLD